MRKQIKKHLLILIGIVFVALGIIGALLPILPTTPFLLLALACFSNSSPRFHQVLLNHRWFGSVLRQWEESRSITRASKFKAILLIVLSFVLSIVMLDPRKISCLRFLAQAIDSIALHSFLLLQKLHSLHPCSLKKYPLNLRVKLKNFLSYMDVVNVDYAGAITYQSTVKPISCTINPRSTDFSRINGLTMCAM